MNSNLDMCANFFVYTPHLHYIVIDVLADYMLAFIYKKKKREEKGKPFYCIMNYISHSIMKTIV